MKTLILILIAFTGLFAQEPSANFAAGGISYSPGASPSIAGTGLYARLVANTGTYAFTVVDALPASVHPFTVTTQFAAGIAQKIFAIKGASIYVPTAAGISYSGTNTGWSWSTGGMATIPVKNGWSITPSVRLLKSSVSNGAGYQVISGVAVGYRWGTSVVQARNRK